MTPVVMNHPKFGTMPCYNEAQVEFNLKNGWTLVNRKTSAKVSTMYEPKDGTVDAPVVDDLKQAYIAKFGRPPRKGLSRERLERIVRGV